MSIVPAKVRIKVGLLCAAALAALLCLPLALKIPLVIYGAYLIWCLWPRWRWGLPDEKLAHLAKPEGQRLCLSFDDGPTESLTEQILDLLKAHGVKASFFVLVAKARKQPECIRRMIREGHTVGLHGEDHRRPFFRSSREIARSLGAAHEELEKIAGAPVELYRPSHGHKNWALVRAMRNLPLRFCFWDYGVWDTDAPPADTLAQRLRLVSAMAETKAEGADSTPTVLLLHDGRGDPDEKPAHAESLLKALQNWLPEIKEARS